MAEHVWPSGRDLIAAERRRQVETEGWTEEHDREHGPQMLAAAAQAYWHNDPQYWPWHGDWWKPKSQFRNLVRAGALYMAALDITASNAVPGRGYYESLIRYVADDIDGLLAEIRAALAPSDPATDTGGEGRGDG